MNKNDYIGVADSAAEKIDAELAGLGMELTDDEYEKMVGNLQYLVKQIIETRAT